MMRGRESYDELMDHTDKEQRRAAITTGFDHASSDQINAALDLPNGARYYRCALQVNPFAYLKRYNRVSDFNSEEDYNSAIVEACIENNIEVIAVTDHYRISDSLGLLAAVRKAGLWAFGGFEAVAKDGVHFLCIFDPDKDQHLESYLGACGIHDKADASPTGCLDSTELLAASKKWRAVCIAAHVASKGGLLKKLSGTSRINVWKNPELLACALPGTATDTPEGIRQILENKDAQHKRERLPAILNAADVNDPEDLKKDAASCFIKMSKVSVEALRQAFLDPDSRIRKHSDPTPDPHAKIVAMTWEGGFLRDTAVHFSENLNVLVGGRGTGKSTMIESMRYALGLDPLGNEARKAYEGVTRHVLQSGTKVSMLVQSHGPSPHRYTIERTVPNPPVVKDEKTGEVLTLSPRDVAPGTEVFGQHEISELTKSPEKLTRLLERFVDRDTSLSDRKSEVLLELEKSRTRIVEVLREMKSLDERLAGLPGLEETLKRFQEARLEEKLKKRSLLVREDRIFSSLSERLEQYRSIKKELFDGLPVDTAFVSDRALEALPNADILKNITRILQLLDTKLVAVEDQFEKALDEADRAVDETATRWKERRTAIENSYEKLLRELQNSKIDGAEFIKLREQIEDLRPLKDKTANLKRDLQVHQGRRRNLLSEWEGIKASEFRRLETAAKRVSRKLRDRIKVKVSMAGDREPLVRLLREIGGNISAALERLIAQEELSLPELAQSCCEGKETLKKKYGFPVGSAERIAQAGFEIFMRIEELDLPATTRIDLNTATDNEEPNWQPLHSLSTGQKATAVLLLLLLESEAPLVVDQPEDDLDNRFITEGVVPIMRQEKCRRQFVFSTHNANIPVLGDAELILGLEAKEGNAKIARDHMGSIDSLPVRELVEEILEGGKAAFEMRRSKYGF